MSALDIFVILMLAGGALVGFVRGFVHEVLALGAWLVAILALKMFHEPVSASLAGWTSTGAAAAALSFAVIFLPVFILFRLLARTLGKRSRRSVLGPLDRFLGGGFGMLKGLVGATLVFLLANLGTDMVYGAAAQRPEWMRRSQTFPLLNATARAIVDGVQSYRGTETNR